LLLLLFGDWSIRLPCYYVRVAFILLKRGRGADLLDNPLFKHFCFLCTLTGDARSGSFLKIFLLAWSVGIFDLNHFGCSFLNRLKHTLILQQFLVKSLMLILGSQSRLGAYFDLGLRCRHSEGKLNVLHQFEVTGVVH